MNNSQTLMPRSEKKVDVRKLTLMAILSAISAIVMMFEFPLWFAPGFYKIDLSEVVVLVGAFALGPIEAIVIEFLKVLLNTLFVGTTTVYIGEIANFAVGCLFVVPAAVVYRRNKTKKSAVIGLALGTISLTVFASLINYFVLLPVYSKFYGVPIDAFVGQGAEKNSAINSVATLVILATVPFNLVKGIISSAVTLVIYKYISPIIKIRK